jgi:hypothetical protein
MGKKKDFSQTSDIPDGLRHALVGMTEENWPELMEAMKQLALGIWVEQITYDKKNRPTNVRVYQQKPDKDFLQYLANQAIGKPKESMNVEGKVSLIMDE